MSLLLLFGGSAAAGADASGSASNSLSLSQSVSLTNSTPIITSAAPDRGWESYFKQLGEEKLARLHRDDDDVLRLMELDSELVTNLLRGLLRQ